MRPKAAKLLLIVQRGLNPEFGKYPEFGEFTLLVQNILLDLISNHDHTKDVSN